MSGVLDAAPPVETEEHEVHYLGRVDPRPGTVLGFGLDGRRAVVAGSMHQDGLTTVYVDVEPFVPGSDIPPIVQAIASAAVTAYNAQLAEVAG